MRNYILFLFGLFAIFTISSCSTLSNRLLYQYVDEDNEIEENAYNICYEYGRESVECREAWARIGNH